MEENLVQEHKDNVDQILRETLHDPELDKYLSINSSFSPDLDTNINKIIIRIEKEDFDLELYFDYLLEHGGPIIGKCRNFVGNINGVEIKQNQIELIVNNLEEKIKKAKQISI